MTLFVRRYVLAGSLFLAFAWPVVVVAQAPVAAAAASAPGVASQVVDWAGTLDESTSKVPGVRNLRLQAIAWLAAFNALDAIDPRFRSYAPAPAPLLAGGASPAPEAALAAAIYTVAAIEPEADLVALRSRYRDALASVKNPAERDAGVALGQQAALLLLNARSGDKVGRTEPPALETGPGKFVQPAAVKVPRSITLARLAPFGLRSPLAFDPGPPPAPGSEAARREVAETRALGSAASPTRSGDQTAAALFWNSDAPGDFLAVLRPALEARGLDALALARIFAIDAMISVDSRIVGMTLKERYLHWRPETAITGTYAAEADREPGWLPLFPAPPDSQYPSGGGTGAGIMEIELPRLLGMAGPIEWRNGATRQVRRWPNAAALSDELAASRVWGGVHFRSSVEAGRRVGRAVATEIIDTQLLPR